MKKKKKYLPLYYKWMETGMMPEDGLCNSLGEIDPETDELCQDEFFKLFKNGLVGYWGYAGEPTKNLQAIDPKGPWRFTPLRQTILLLIAAMNGEL